MMTKLLAATVLSLTSLTFAACQPAPPVASTPDAPKAPARKLDIGDAAPAIKVTTWLQGAKVEKFESGKVYVLEFWATWCGPCIRAMPHLTELANEYKDKGLVVVGITSKDENGNDAKKVAEFVEKNGKKFTYAFAYCEDRDTDKAYMEAAQQDGIPCSFVIGKDGKIAFIGHPMELDDVLPKVIDGTWKGKEDYIALQKANEELETIMQGGEKDPAGSLTKLDEFAKKYPNKAKASMFSVQKMVLTMQAKKFDDAKILAESMIAASVAAKNAEKAAFAGMILGDKNLNPEKKHMDVAMKALDTALQFESKDIGLFIQAAGIYFEAGDKAKAAELADKAIAAAEDENTKKQVEKIVSKYKK